MLVLPLYPQYSTTTTASMSDVIERELERMSPMEKMRSGELYLPGDDEIMAEQTACLDRQYDFNQTRPTELAKRTAMLREMFAEIGEGTYIEPPLHANWGGKHCHFGKNVYANFNLTLVDDTDIYVGDGTMLGPNVVIATAGHPLHPLLREQQYQYNVPVRIGKNCWLGAGVLVMPGVTIGDNSVIGAGSVVTKDIPANVVAVGNPAFASYAAWEAEFLARESKLRADELAAVASALEICRRRFGSPFTEIRLSISPIKCAYSADYHLHGDAFVFSAGEFRAESVIHEFLHHIVRPFTENHRAEILAADTEYPGIDRSYYLAGDADGVRNAFEEYTVRRLTADILADRVPSELTAYL